MFTKPEKLLNSKAAWFWGMILLQGALLLYTFWKILAAPNVHFFANQYDGLKNYFTLHAYLQQPFEQGVLKFNQFNYPFGDYVLFTDNTPLFTVSLKLFSHYIFDLSNQGFLLFHLFLIGSILLSSVLIFKILQRFVPQFWLIAFFSVALPWLNPQVMRLQVGHFNLSFSWVLLAVFYCLLRIYAGGNTVKIARKWSLILVIVLVSAAFLHMYYLILGVAFTGFFFFFSFIQDLLQQKRNFSGWLLAGLTIFSPLALTYAITRLIDGYYQLRRSGAEGYGWDEWKLTLPAFFTSYGHNKIDFLVRSSKNIPYESHAYLGAFALFGLLFWLLLYFFDKQNRAFLSLKSLLLTNNFLVLCGLAATASVLIAIGEEYFFGDRDYVFKNYLNAFFYVHKVTNQVTQFRCLGRFNWVFFWFFNFAAVFSLSYFLRNYSRRWFAYLAGLLLLLAAADVKDTITHIRKDVISENNLTAEKATQDMRLLLQQVDVKQYQAILPVPYYHVGSEDYNFTIDPEEGFATETMRLSVMSDLPLMGNKMSRTPQPHAEMLFSIFTEAGMASTLKQELGEKPVLVLVNKTFFDGSNTYGNNLNLEPAKSVFAYGPKVVPQYNMKKLAENGAYELYRWDL